jgi:hypothetical protein
MALTGIENLADRLVNQSQPLTEQSSADRTPGTGLGSSTSKSSAAIASAAAPDEFTLSAQTAAAGATAQAAGLFSVATLSLFTAAAKFLLGDSRSAAPAASPTTPAPIVSDLLAPAVATVASSAGNPSAQNTTPAPGSGNSPAIASPANADHTPALATAPVNSAVSTFSASSATSGTAVALIPPSSVAQSASLSGELQSLNTALSALGLPQSDIAVIDRLAALLKDFSPAAYADLLHQFETLAQSQLAPSAATPSSTTSSNLAAASASEVSTLDGTNAANVSASPNLAAVTSGAQPSSLQTNLSTADPAAGSLAGAVPKGSSSARGATFQVQDLVIRFASVSQTLTNNTGKTLDRPPSATNSKTRASNSSTLFSQANVLNLGVKEISVTLNNSLGQRAHVRVAQSGLRNNSTSPALASGPILTKSAKA